MFTKRSLLRLFSILLIVVFMLTQVTSAYASGTSWKDTGSLTAARFAHTATLLSNGQVLAVGGHNNVPVLIALASAELYNPTTGLWTSTDDMFEARYYHTATLLNDGRVLVVGGQSGNGFGDALDSAELYDPNAPDGSKWTPTGNTLSQARQHHTATLLDDGRVLVVGGDDGSVFSSAELYDPVDDQWTNAAPLTQARQSHTATLLLNDKVLVVGGFNNGRLASAELYTPVDDAPGSWASTGSLIAGRDKHTATLLVNDANGRVLVVGGDDVNAAALNSAELYNPLTGVWTATGALTEARHAHAAVLLANNKVMVIGGHDFNNPSLFLAGVELYDPASGNWTSTGPLIQGRRSHTATKLSNNQVLAVGGEIGTGLVSAELYGTPVVVSITRVDANPSSAGIVHFTVNFSASMSGVDASDFDFFTTDDISGASVTGITPAGPATTYTVTVGSYTGNLGNLRLDLIDDDTIVDPALNKLGGPGLVNGDFTSGEEYQIDRTPPSITSFTLKTPATSPTNANTLVFLATFSEPVTDVDTADFVKNSSSTATVTGVSPVTTSTYDVTISGGDLAGFNGTVNLNLVGVPTINDLADNALPASQPGTDQTYTVDNIAPDTQIDSTPASLSASASATFTFSSPSPDGTAFECSLDNGIYVACASGQNYPSLDDGGHTFAVRAKDPAGNVDATPPSYAWTIDTLLPTVVYSVRITASPTNATSVQFSVRFFEPVTGVNVDGPLSDFSLTSTVTGASITSISGSGTTYTVTVNTGSGNGNIQLNVLDNDSIEDAAGNKLASAFNTGETYAIDKSITLTINSTASQDGWILEADELSAKGGILNAKTPSFSLGDNVANQQYRVILSFSTGLPLPDNATITSVTLKFKKQAVVGGGNPVNTFKGFYFDIKNGIFGKATLQASDFQSKVGSQTFGPFKPVPVSNWYSINLNSAAAKINTLSAGSGLTQIRVRFKLDDNNNMITNTLNIYSGNSGPANRPQLIITYLP